MNKITKTEYIYIYIHIYGQVGSVFRKEKHEFEFNGKQLSDIMLICNIDI